jgi:hypothetical protein
VKEAGLEIGSAPVRIAMCLASFSMLTSRTAEISHSGNASMADACYRGVSLPVVRGRYGTITVPPSVAAPRTTQASGGGRPTAEEGSRFSTLVTITMFPESREGKVDENARLAVHSSVARQLIYLVMSQALQ